MRGRRATPFTRVPAGENPYATGLQPESSVCHWAGGSSLLKNLHCLIHFHSTKSSQFAWKTDLERFAEPRCGALAPQYDWKV
jgi:hypothetical protein